MARPAQVTRLIKGKLIDVQEGFVDTFNYLVDFCENLIGEGEQDAGKNLVVDRTLPDSPVIRGGGEGSEKDLETECGTFSLISGDDSNVKFTKTSPDGQIFKIDVYYK